MVWGGGGVGGGERDRIVDTFFMISVGLFDESLTVHMNLLKSFTNTQKRHDTT